MRHVYHYPVCLWGDEKTNPTVYNRLKLTQVVKFKRRHITHRQRKVLEGVRVQYTVRPVQTPLKQEAHFFSSTLIRQSKSILARLEENENKIAHTRERERERKKDKTKKYKCDGVYISYFGPVSLLFRFILHFSHTV